MLVCDETRCWIEKFCVLVVLAKGRLKEIKRVQKKWFKIGSMKWVADTSTFNHFFYWIKKIIWCFFFSYDRMPPVLLFSLVGKDCKYHSRTDYDNERKNSAGARSDITLRHLATEQPYVILIWKPSHSRSMVFYKLSFEGREFVGELWRNSCIREVGLY